MNFEITKISIDEYMTEERLDSLLPGDLIFCSIFEIGENIDISSLPDYVEKVYNYMVSKFPKKEKELTDVYNFYLNHSVESNKYFMIPSLYRCPIFINLNEIGIIYDMEKGSVANKFSTQYLTNLPINILHDDVKEFIIEGGLL